MRLVLPVAAGRPPTVLSSFVQPEALRLEDLRASSGGAVLAAERFLDGGFERWRIAAPPAGGPIVVEYVVRPGAAETAGMSGPTGYRFGHLDSGFGLFTGRQIFVFPAGPAPPVFDVVFLLPEGWDLIAPWPRAAGAAAFRVDGPAAAARLLRAVLGAGAFETAAPRGVEAPDRFRVHVLASLPAEARARSSGRALALEEYLARRLGRPARGYDLILVPRAPDGTYVSVSPSPEGFGLSLGDGLATRWLSVGRLLGRAMLQDRLDALAEEAPARRALEGLPLYLSAQFAHRDRWRWTHVLLEQFYYNSAGLDLTDRPADPGPLVREYRAALVLHHLSRALERTALGSLDHVLLGENTREALLDWHPFVRRLPADVRDALAGWMSPAPRPFPFPGEDAAPPRLLPAPPPIASGALGRRFDLYLGGRNLGLLEQCGCRSGQTGGMARRAALLRRRLAGPVPAAAVEIGDAVPFDQKSPVLDRQKKAEASLALALMAHAGTAGLNVSHAEVTYGPEFLKDLASRLPRGFRLFSASVQVPGLALPPDLRLPPGPPRAGRPAVRIFGLAERGNYHLGRALEHEDATAGVRFTDPVEAMRRALARPRGRGETPAAAGYLSPTTVLRLAREFPDLPLIVTHDYFRFNEDPRLRFERPLEGLSTFGILDRTLVVQLQSDAYGLVRLGLLLRDDGGIVGAELEDLVLDDSIPDDPQVRARLDAHYDRLARDAGLSDHPPVGGLLAARLGSPYTGAVACSSCHAGEAEQWRTTPHAAAFATLLARNRQGVPGCVACHVTGYRQDGGYHAIADLSLRHVQCESCHGPGGRHVEAPSSANIVRTPPATVCRECHNEKHSDMTSDNYGDYLARVVHAPPGG